MLRTHKIFITMARFSTCIVRFSRGAMAVFLPFGALRSLCVTSVINGTLLMVYEKVDSCVRYHSYRFLLPKNWQQKQHQSLAKFVLSLGENKYPESLGVLQIRHDAFFLDYPSFGYPYFKISFYKDCSKKTRQNYLRLLADQLHYINGMGSHA